MLFLPGRREAPDGIRLGPSSITMIAAGVRLSAVFG